MLFTIFTTLVATLAHTNSKKKKKKAHSESTGNFGTTKFWNNCMFPK